jgi:hypothetical protein
MPLLVRCTKKNPAAWTGTASWLLFFFFPQVHSQRAGEEPARPPPQLSGKAERHRAARSRQLQAHDTRAAQQGQTFQQTKLFFGGGGSNPLCLSSSLALHFTRLFIFGSTTQFTGMTGISLHKQWPLATKWKSFKVAVGVFAYQKYKFGCILESPGTEKGYLRPFGIVCGHLVFFHVLVCITDKNLATQVSELTHPDLN